MRCLHSKRKCASELTMNGCSYQKNFGPMPKWNGLERTPLRRRKWTETTASHQAAPAERLSASAAEKTTSITGSSSTLKYGSKPIAPVSRKRAKQNRQRTKVLAQMREEDPMCARCRVRPWTDGNELLRRSAGGSITDRENIVGLCRPCHEEIGRHPAQAITDGWQRSRYA